MNYLIGTYECKIDVKGRLLIPIALKKQIADSISQGFVLKRAVFQQCLELYPLQQWKDLISVVAKPKAAAPPQTHGAHNMSPPMDIDGS